MTPSAKKWIKFTLRWGIAVVGMWWVVAQISWRDQVLVLGARNRPVEAKLAAPADENFIQVQIIDPWTGRLREVPRNELVHQPDRESVTVETDRGPQEVDLLALDLSYDLREVERLLVAEGPEAPGEWIEPERVVGGYDLRVPYPLVEAGLGDMIDTADPLFLWLAVLVFPVTYVVTALRWHALLSVLEINLSRGRTFVLNMVGAYYNTFMPGSTGGDLLKAYYAAKHTVHRTRAVISVLVDRIIGLLALVLLGGSMAAYQYFAIGDPDDPTARACLQVALGAAGILVGVGLAVIFFFNNRLRYATGLDRLLRRLPMQNQIGHVVQTARLYRRRPGLVIATIFFSLPVHMTVIVSATLAGIALGLTDLKTYQPLHPMYYWVVVPVVVLSGSLPLTPQGAGVMEFFAIILTRREGCTISQALALTMSIRFVAIFWNLVGGLFLLRGSYRRPTVAEQEAMVQDPAESKPAVMVQ